MYLLPNLLQSRHPAYSEETVSLEMANQRYRAVKHVVSAPKSGEREPLYIAAANGFYEDPHIWNPLAHRLAMIALHEEQPMVMVTYEDSSPNGAHDILALRAERLAHVINSTRSDGMLVISGHSRGWISSVLTAADQKSEVGRLVGFGVAGLAPRPTNNLTINKVNEIAAGQIVSEITEHLGLTNLWEKFAVRQRFIQNSLSLLVSQHQEMYREGTQVLSADVISQTVALSESTPTTIWVHRHDAFFDASTIHTNLSDSGYQGFTRDVPTSHLGPLIDFSLAQDLYRDIVGT